jgi:hypothetical protein
MFSDGVGRLVDLSSLDLPKQNWHTAAMKYADLVTLLGMARSKANITVLVFEEFPIEYYSLNPLQELSGKGVGAVIDHLGHL